MSKAFISSIGLPRFTLWKKMREAGCPVSFDLELTARCNNNCRHCYINLPAGDAQAKKKELSFSFLKKIIDQAAGMGAFWCLLTGGEPLLREDFADIYLYLKKKGMLVSVFTNATLIDAKRASFFKKYPPRDMEVTVYGVRRATYEKVTRRPGSFDEFSRGLAFLLKNKIRVRFKAMALKSNVHELPEISRFCRQRTKDYFRFDPFLHLRYDANPLLNAQIISERLSPEEIVRIEKQDPERFGALEKNCRKLIFPESERAPCSHLFHCGVGKGSFSVTYDGYYKLCQSLTQENCTCDLKKESLSGAWEKLVPRVRGMRSDNPEFLAKCRGCAIVNLCLWCPANAHLETGRLDQPIEYFCQVAYARKNALLKEKNGEKRLRYKKGN